MRSRNLLRSVDEEEAAFVRSGRVCLLPSASVSFLFLRYITAAVSRCASGRDGEMKASDWRPGWLRGQQELFFFLLFGFIRKYYSLKWNIWLLKRAISPFFSPLISLFLASGLNVQFATAEFRHPALHVKACPCHGPQPARTGLLWCFSSQRVQRRPVCSEVKLTHFCTKRHVWGSDCRKVWQLCSLSAFTTKPQQ